MPPPSIRPPMWNNQPQIPGTDMPPVPSGNAPPPFVPPPPPGVDPQYPSSVSLDLLNFCQIYKEIDSSSKLCNCIFNILLKPHFILQNWSAPLPPPPTQQYPWSNGNLLKMNKSFVLIRNFNIVFFFQIGNFVPPLPAVPPPPPPPPGS